MKVERSSDKLKGLEESLGAPVKLSDKEKEKFKEVFDGVKEWVDDAHDGATEMNQDEAYRYLRLLLSALKKVDADFKAGAKAKEAAPLSDLTPIEEEPLKPVEPIIRPTKEQVDEWLGQMTPEARAKVEALLSCMKQYLDPEGPGIKIICNFCNKEKIVRCLKDADPTITDASTVFMNFQQAD